MSQSQQEDKQPMVGGSGANRMTARGVLRSLIARRERELAGWRALLVSLPEPLLPEADEALWQLLVGQHGGR